MTELRLVLPRPGASALREWLVAARLLGLLLLAALTLRTLVVMPRTIPSESMMPTLVEGDFLLVAKWPYGWSRFALPRTPPGPRGRLFGRDPARGDVVVFRAPPREREDYVKRVIGLPGDTVAMRGGVPIVNGRAARRERIADFVLPIDARVGCLSVALAPYGRGTDPSGRAVCRFPRYRETLPGGRSYVVIDQGGTPQDEMAPVTVSPGRYFLLGDNRDISEDSRFATATGGIGLVPADNLEGRAAILLFSLGGTHGVRADRLLRPIG